MNLCSTQWDNRDGTECKGEIIIIDAEGSEYAQKESTELTQIKEWSRRK